LLLSVPIDISMSNHCFLRKAAEEERAKKEKEAEEKKKRAEEAAARMAAAKKRMEDDDANVAAEVASLSFPCLHNDISTYYALVG